jgi:hypothetical protein
MKSKRRRRRNRAKQRDALIRDILNEVVDKIFHFPSPVSFARRSRTEKLDHHIVPSAGVSYVNFGHVHPWARTWSSFPESRVFVTVNWPDPRFVQTLHMSMILQKSVFLSNVVRETPGFPQTVRGFFRRIVATRSPHWYRFSACGFRQHEIDIIMREYLLLQVWKKLEDRLGPDTMTVYGWFSDD